MVIFIPTLGSEVPQWVQSRVCVHLSIYVSVSMSGRPRRFFVDQIVRPIIACSACGCCIYRGRGHFYIQKSRHFVFCNQTTIMCMYVFLYANMYICLSFYLSLCVQLSVSLFGDQNVRAVIACSACSCYIYRGERNSYIQKSRHCALRNRTTVMCLSVITSLRLSACLSVSLSGRPR